MYSEKDIYIKDNTLTIRRNVYPLSKIITIEAKKLALKDKLIRIVSISIAVSAAGWLFIPTTGPFLTLVGALIAITTNKRYELRAELPDPGQNDTYWISLARGRKEQELALFKFIAANIS